MCHLLEIQSDVEACSWHRIQLHAPWVHHFLSQSRRRCNRLPLEIHGLQVLFLVALGIYWLDSTRRRMLSMKMFILRNHGYLPLTSLFFFCFFFILTNPLHPSDSNCLARGEMVAKKCAPEICKRCLL